MIRAALFSVLVMSALWSGAARADADGAYQDAKSAYTKLKGDQKRRALRHHWQNVAKKFEAVATRYPKSERAPEALFNSGELNNELSRFSAKDEDRDAAKRSFRRLLEGWPKHKLSDDAAWSLARLLADREGDTGGARKVLEQGLKNAGDKKKDMQAMLAVLPAAKSAKTARDDDDERASKKSARSDDDDDDRGSKQSGRTDDEDPPRKRAKASRDDDRTKKSGFNDDDGPSKSAKASRVDDDRAKKNGSGDGAGAQASRDAERTAKKSAPTDGPSGKPRAPSAKLSDSDDDEEEDEGLPPAIDVAEAIRRAIKPLEGVAPKSGGDGPLTAQARRLPSGRPTATDDQPTGREASDDVEEGEAPVVASLAERLRDVRVGARAPQESEAKTRLARLAKAENELSLAQQLGLKVRRVIIDAGHGGHDTGAIGPKGTREKDVSLAIAKKLAAQLEAAGLEVLLTRDDDTYVKLEDRTKFANEHKGDLFISVHCNAAPTKSLRGVETYTLNTSSNRYSIRLAARENSTTERGVGDLQYILADLATKANTGESSQLAERVQRSIVRDLSGTWKGVKDLGTKEALFFVLLGARMPAILVETSFLSHPEEEERLADEKYQQRIADSIAEAVTGFLEERNKLAQVD